VDDCEESLGYLVDRLHHFGVRLDYWSDRLDRDEEDDTNARELGAALGIEEHAIRWLIRRGSPGDAESDSLKTKGEKRAIRRILARVSEIAARQISDYSNPRELLERFEEITIEQMESDAAGDDLLNTVGVAAAIHHVAPIILLLTGDELSRARKSERAVRAYDAAVNLAWTPQANVEIGCLLARRSAVEFPVPWHPTVSGLTPSVLLEWDRWTGFPGLPEFEVFYEELSPGPQAENLSALRRLALESYGRALLPYARVPFDGDSYEKFGSFLDPLRLLPLIIDGLNVLLSAEDAHTQELNSACLMTIFNCDDGGFGANHVEDRLRVCETYLAGRQHGREDAEAAHAAFEVASRRVVVDPDEFRTHVIAGVVEELRSDLVEIRESLGGLSNRTQNEVLEQLRSDIPRWSECPNHVKEFLREADSKLRLREWGYANLIYGKAAEALLRHATGSRQAMLGDIDRSPVTKALLEAKMHDAAKLDLLLDDFNFVRRWKNPESHSDRRQVPAATEESTKDVRKRTIRIANALIDRLESKHDR
jgi:hypothetical protein